MITRCRFWVILGIAAFLAVVMGANWRFIDSAFRSHPGCVPEHRKHPAAEPEC